MQFTRITRDKIYEYNEANVSGKTVQYVLTATEGQQTFQLQGNPTYIGLELNRAGQIPAIDYTFVSGSDNFQTSEARDDGDKLLITEYP